MKKKYIILILASLFVFSSCTTHPLWGLNRNRKNTLYRNMREPDFKEPAEKGEINLNLSLPYLNSRVYWVVGGC
jgi:PBP1b-binding outer membrane lipoprotein LpoB